MRRLSQSVSWVAIGFGVSLACGEGAGAVDEEPRCAELTEQAAAFLAAHAACSEHADCQQLPAEHYVDNRYCWVAANRDADSGEWADLADALSGACTPPDGCYEEDLGNLAVCIDSVCTIVAPGSCVEDSTPLPGVDDVGAAGVSAAEVLAQTEGQYAGELMWIENLVSHENKNTTSPVDITVSHDGGEIRDVRVTALECVEGHGCHPCPAGKLEIDVSMRVVSEDGAADETLAVTLVQEGTHPDPGIGTPAPYVYHPYDPDVVPGGIESTDLVLPPEAAFLGLVLTANFADDVCSGEIGAEAEIMGGVGFGPIASWEATRI